MSELDIQGLITEGRTMSTHESAVSVSKRPMDPRIEPCAMCKKPVVYESRKTDDLDCPEMIRIVTLGAWFTVVDHKGTAEVIVACSEDCADRMMAMPAEMLPPYVGEREHHPKLEKRVDPDGVSARLQKLSDEGFHIESMKEIDADGKADWSMTVKEIIDPDTVEKISQEMEIVPIGKTEDGKFEKFDLRPKAGCGICGRTEPHEHGSAYPIEMFQCWNCSGRNPPPSTLIANYGKDGVCPDCNYPAGQDPCDEKHHGKRDIVYDEMAKRYVSKAKSMFRMEILDGVFGTFVSTGESTLVREPMTDGKTEVVEKKLADTEPPTTEKSPT